MKQFLFKTLLCAGIATTACVSSQAQISLVQDYKNNTSATIGSFQGISLREAGFSGLFPIAGTNGKEFWVCSDRGPNVDAAAANPSTCRPTYDKIYALPNYVPKIHRIRLNGDSIQILRTITIKRPNKTGARGVLLPTGLGSLAVEEGSTDTVLDCANFSSKLATKDTFAIDAEGIVVDKEGYFWLCEESGASIWKLNPDGVVVARYTPYKNLGGAQAVDIQIDTAFKYRKNNRGFESIAIAPNGKIYAMIQSPLLYPTLAVGDNSRVHRMLEITPSTGAMRMFVYLNDGVVGTSSQIRLRDWKTGDMAAINDSTFLVLEAAARGGIDIKRLYKISLTGATVVTSGLYSGNTVEALVDSTGLAAQGIVAVKKTLVMDLLGNSWPAALDKAEGVAILNDSTIFIANDNDYGLTVTAPDNGIAVATTNVSHVIRYSLKGANKLSNVNLIQPDFLAGVSGQSSSQPPFILPTTTGGQFTAIISGGDAAPNGYKMVGIPDGAGAFDNNNGTFTLLLNHELNNNVGVTRAHGGIGAFVSKWIINKSDLSVVSGSDLITTYKLWNPVTSSFISYNSVFVNTAGLQNLGRFCSADVPAITALYNPNTGKGTQARMILNGEETGIEGRGFAHIATGPEAGTAYELPYTGKFAWENNVAAPRISDTTVVAGTDDGTGGQVYFYVGLKQSTGNEIEKAGLHGGNLWGVSVPTMLTETSAGVPTPGTAFTMINLGQVQNMTGATLNTNSVNNGVTTFLRPEDGAWDPQNPADFYFNTTNAFNAPSRLWKLHFNNAGNVTQGGTITAVLDGTEGQQMLDNLCFDNTGLIIEAEDVGGNNHIGKLWQYNIANDSFKIVGRHDSTRFLNNSANFLTVDEEASGQFDAQAILGPGMFLLVDQVHRSLPGELVEDGQIMAFYNPETAIRNPEVNLTGAGITIADDDITPNVGDNTDFGVVNTNTTQNRTFTIQNTLTGPLNVRSLSISGPNASSFTLVSPPTVPFTIAAGGSQTITVQFAPTVDSTRNATLNFVSNDINEEYYNVALRGTGGSPEISVLGSGNLITDGDVTPGLGNNTDFGSVIVGNNLTKTFSIQNNGAGSLTITGITAVGVNSSEFTLVGAPAFPLTIPSGAGQVITVQFTPGAEGIRTAALNIANNDVDESTYDFVLQGRGANTTGINNVANSSIVKLYPNPTGGNATVAMSLKKEDRIIITILNQEGRVAIAPIDRTYRAGDQEISLPTSGLANGIYFVQIATGTNTIKMKLVVAH